MSERFRRLLALLRAKHFRAAAAGCACIALVACTATQQAATNKALADATAACTAAGPIVSAIPNALSVGGVSASTAATVASLLAYEQSVCSSEAAIASAANAPSGGSTSTWITNIAGGLLQALPMILTLVGA